MAESLILFESVINSRWFLRTSIILFLNKIDVFKTKLPNVRLETFMSSVSSHPHQVPLERYFPEYVGGADVNKATKYILWRFMQTNRARLSVYPQYVLILCTPSLAHASNQYNTSNGHDKHSFSIRSGEGNDLTECIKRLGHSVVLAFSLLPFLFTLLFSFSLSPPVPLSYKSCSLSIGKNCFVRDHYYTQYFIDSLHYLCMSFLFEIVAMALVPPLASGDMRYVRFAYVYHEASLVF